MVMTLAHGLAAAGAACVIWQTVELAKKAVLCWACWTEFYPLLWVCHGVLHHLLSVFCLRVSLGTEDVATSVPRQRVPASKSRSVLFEPDLTLQSLHVVVKREKFLRWSKVFLDVMNNVNYLYGTMVFSSLTLVSPVAAMKILVYFGVVAMGASIIGTWAVGEISVQD